jgi:hypothetical protein
MRSAEPIPWLRSALAATRRTFFCVLYAACCIALFACGTPPPDSAGALDAVEQFVAALEARDASAIIRLMEPSDYRGELGPELRAYLGMLEVLELRDPRYSVVEQDGNLAVVAVEGIFAYSFAETEESGERAVDLHVETIFVDDAWYLRGVELPQP